jgi:hypothetical protein
MPDSEFKAKADGEKLDTELVVFKPSQIHGLGGFAKTDLLAGVCVLEYEGEKIDKQESARRCELDNVYIFALNDQLDLDGDFPCELTQIKRHPGG